MVRHAVFQFWTTILGGFSAPLYLECPPKKSHCVWLFKFLFIHAVTCSLDISITPFHSMSWGVISGIDDGSSIILLEAQHILQTVCPSSLLYLIFFTRHAGVFSTLQETLVCRCCRPELSKLEMLAQAYRQTLSKKCIPTGCIASSPGLFQTLLKNGLDRFSAFWLTASEQWIRFCDPSDHPSHKQNSRIDLHFSS